MARSRAVDIPSAGKLQSLRESSAQFWILAVLLLLVFAMGGGSRADIQSLQFLRPLAILAAAFGVATIKPEHFRPYWSLFAIFAAAALLVVAHLVPLPPSVWQALPGRDIISDIDEIAGLQGAWRPLSMYPEGTWNALYALSVPAAVLLLGVQLQEREHLRILKLVIGLGLVSGLIGVMQAAGQGIQFYRISSETAGLFANRNHQAALLAALFPMLAALAAVAQREGKSGRASNLLAGIAMVALVPLIIVTGSRAGLLVGAIAILCLGYMRFDSPGKRRQNRRSSLVLKLLAALAVVTLLVIATFVSSRNVAFERFSATSEEVRWPVWTTIVEFLPSYLPWGTGIGSYALVYQIHELPNLLMRQYSNQAHNDWLEVILIAGLPGAALLVAAVVAFLIGVKRSFGGRGSKSIMTRAGLVVILLLAFASVSDYPLRTPILASIFVLAAIWASGIQQKTKPAGSTSKNA
ncbi:O-antigen ligase family protein [Altererythrobacter arenosus]|uniref:O-antigen ligase family protein n=1 Tax=Altererythrobacter arenosus TaxID=3032592 RepID=A0ABY8FZH8_9SPHN|nr:O-antigen ligase family protein [Altererythrobacter sp. CAU 1644]WFL78726.1 O-antigen ligase family protein [Altererythrobacter sp. CAU 1644]